ncbi:MAG: hypothetical protein ACLPWS_15115 [Rhodomicrobium sp.]
MLKHLTISALATAAILAAAAISPASAGRFGGGHGFRYGGGHHGGQHFGGHFNGHRFGGQRYGGRFGGRHFGPHHFGHHWAHWHQHWRFGPRGWAWYDEGAVYVDGGYAAAAGAPPAPCTCLGKEYMEDGSVRFFDRCTKETAIGAPAPRG